MYDDYSENVAAIPVDERESLMHEFVKLDRELSTMTEDRLRLDERIDKGRAKQNEIRNRLSDALGLSGKESGMKMQGAAIEGYLR